jgi:hypothetical protein
VTKQMKTLIGVAVGAAAIVAVTVGIVVTVNVDRDEPTGDDPVRELAEQEIEGERQAQENNRQVREGLQDAARQLQEEQGDEGVAGAFGGDEEYEQRQEEKRQAARDAKAKAAGFDTWEAYQQSLTNGSPSTRPN